MHFCSSVAQYRLSENRIRKYSLAFTGYITSLDVRSRE